MDEITAEQIGFRAFITAHVHIFVFRLVVNVVDVFSYMRSRGAVECIEEFLDRQFLVVIWIPEQLGVNIGAERGQLAVFEAGSILLEDTGHIVIDEYLQVMLAMKQVRVRQQEIREIRRVVPDPETIRFF